MNLNIMIQDAKFNPVYTLWRVPQQQFLCKLEIPNDAYTTFSRNLIGRSTLSQELCKVFGWCLEIMRRQLWTLSCPVIGTIMYDQPLIQDVHVRRCVFNLQPTFLTILDTDESRLKNPNFMTSWNSFSQMLAIWVQKSNDNSELPLREYIFSRKMSYKIAGSLNKLWKSVPI